MCTYTNHHRKRTSSYLDDSICFSSSYRENSLFFEEPSSPEFCILSDTPLLFCPPLHDFCHESSAAANNNKHASMSYWRKFFRTLSEVTSTPTRTRRFIQRPRPALLRLCCPEEEGEGFTSSIPPFVRQHDHDFVGFVVRSLLYDGKEALILASTPTACRSGQTAGGKKIPHGHLTNLAMIHGETKKCEEENKKKNAAGSNFGTGGGGLVRRGRCAV